MAIEFFNGEEGFGGAHYINYLYLIHNSRPGTIFSIEDQKLILLVKRNA